uniref:Uncharacterized protein n=1 Tax=Sphaerodactylus townsendi TaxID=933632 RepID=A0ACB8F9U6_9SAUR
MSSIKMAKGDCETTNGPDVLHTHRSSMEQEALIPNPTETSAKLCTFPPGRDLLLIGSVPIGDSVAPSDIWLIVH